MDRVLNDISFNDKTRDAMRESYNDIVKYMDNDLSKYQSGQVGKAVLAECFLRQIKEKMRLVADNMSSGACSRSILHTVWTNLWETILKAIAESNKGDASIMYV